MTGAAITRIAGWMIILAWIAGSSAAGDWRGWRGNDRDGHAADLPVPETWPPSLAKHWTVEVGVGDASPLVVSGRVFQFSHQKSEEIVRALDLETGKEIWRQAYMVDFMAGMGAGKHGKGPNATPAVGDGRLFTLGISGILSAWDTASGKLLWRHESADLYRDEAPRFGAASSPLLTDDLLVVHLGGKRGALLGLRPENGEEVWSWNEEGPAYASPIRAEYDGVSQIITQSLESIVAVDAGTGALLWQIPFKSSFSIHNSVTPVVYEDLLVLSGKKRGIWAVRPRRDGDAWHLDEVWRHDELPVYLSSPVVAGDRLFALSHLRKGQLFLAEAATGEMVWKNEGRTADNAALLTAPGVLLMLTTDAELIVLDARSDDLKRLVSYQVADSATWAHPAIAGEKILIKDAESLTLWSLEHPAETGTANR